MIEFVADLAPTVLILAASALGVVGRVSPATACGLIAAPCWASFVCDLFTGVGAFTYASAAMALLCTWLWWRGQGREEGRAGALGAKSRALLRALAGRVSPSRVPSPAGG